MVMHRLAGLLALIPTSLLLTVSFFVLYSLRKVEQEKLKIFGFVVAVMLWISAGLVLSGGLYHLVTGRPPMRCCPMMGMKPMHPGLMKKMHCNKQMLREQTPPMPMQAVAEKKEENQDKAGCGGNKGMIYKAE